MKPEFLFVHAGGMRGPDSLLHGENFEGNPL